MEPIHIYIHSDAHYEPLLNEWFLPTFQDFDEPDVTVDVVWSNPKLKGYADKIREKNHCILESLRRHRDEIVIWPDVDIQFFRPIIPTIREAIKGNNAVFMRESNRVSVHCGFKVLRCNHKMEKTWEAIVKAGKPRRESSTIRRHLVRNKVRPRILPNLFWTVSLGRFNPKQVLLHHAIRAHDGPGNTLKKKIHQLRKYREEYDSWKLRNLVKFL